MQSVSTEEPAHGLVAANGLTLHYVEWRARPASPGAARASQSSGEALLLLHGSVGNARVWDEFARGMMAGGCHEPIIALDLRGHGESEWANPSAYKCEDYVGDLEAVTEGLPLRPVVLIAHSMAVYHSIRFAAAHPDRVAGLVLIDIEAKCRDEHAQLLRSAGRKPHPVFSSIEQALERDRRVFPFASEHDLRAFVASNLCRVSGESGESEPGLTYKYDRASLADFDDYDERDRLSKIQCPALVVCGKQSPLGRPDKMQEMASSIPRGEFIAIDRAGHLPQLDNPDELARAVLEFPRRTG